MNVVSIEVRAKDRAIPVFKDVSGAAEKAVSRVADSSRGIVGRAANATKAIFTNVTTSLVDMGDAIVSKLGTALKVGLAGVGIAAGAALFGGVRRLLNIEDAIHSLGKMGLTGKQTRKLMDDLDQTMIGMTFTLDSGANAIKRLITSGAPLDEVINRFKLLTDAAAFGKVPLSEMINIFEKVQAEGKLTGFSLRQLQIRGIPALNLLADAAGVTEEQFRSMVSSGKIDTEKFFELWEKGSKGFGDANIKMEGAAKSMEETTRGSFKNMLTVFSRAVATFAGPLFVRVKEVFQGITQSIRDVMPHIEDFGQRFAEATEQIIQNKVIPALGRMADTFKNTIIPALKDMIEWVSDNRETINKFLKAVIPAIGIVSALAVAVSLLKSAFIFLIKFTPIGIITALVAALVFAWQNSERFREVVTKAFDRVKEAADRVWQFIKTNLLPIFVMLGEFLIGTLVPAIGGFLAAALQPLWSFFKDKLLPILTDAIQVLKDSVLPTFIEWWSIIAETLLPILGTLINVGLQPLTAWWGVLADIVKNVVLPAIGAMFDFFREKILPVLRRVAEFTRDSVIPAFEDFKDAVSKNVIEPIQRAWAEFKENYLPILKEAAEETRDRLIKVWEDLKDVWNDDLKPALDQLRDTFEKDVLPALQTIWEAINDDLLPALEDIWREIDGPLLDALKILGAVLLGAAFSALVGFIKLLGTWAGSISTVIGGVRSLIAWWKRLKDSANRIKKRVTIPGGRAIRQLIQRILSLWGALKRIGSVVLSISAPGLDEVLGALDRARNFIPGMATGGIGSGLTVVGERGRELVDLGASGRVFNNDQTERILSGGNGTQRMSLDLDWKPGFEGRITDAIVHNLLFRLRFNSEIQSALKANPGPLNV